MRTCARPGGPASRRNCLPVAGGRAHVLVSSRTKFRGSPPTSRPGTRCAVHGRLRPKPFSEVLAVLARQERMEMARVALIRYTAPSGNALCGFGAANRCAPGADG